MKTILFILSFILTGTFVKSQYTFSKKSKQAWALDAFQINSGDFFITGMDFGSTEDLTLIRLNTSGDTLWGRTYNSSFGSIGTGLEMTYDGSIIISGSYGVSSIYDPDMLIAKIDTNGNLIWAKAYSAPLVHEGLDIKQTIDSGFIIAGGQRTSAGTMEDICILRTDSSGNILWNLLLQGPNDEVTRSVEQTSDSGYIFSGETSSFGAGSSDALILKFDNSGTLVWDKCYGLSNLEIARSVHQLQNGGYIFTGETKNSVTGIPSALLSRLDQLGDTLWSKTYANGLGTSANFVSETSDGGFVITGEIALSSGHTHVLLIKTDSLGNISWSKRYSTTTGIIEDKGLKVFQTNDGGYFINAQSGYPFYPDGFMLNIKTDSLGNSGCIDSTITLIQMDFHPLIGIPAFSQTSVLTAYVPALTNGFLNDTIQTFCSGTIGIDKIHEEESFVIYPNPANEILTISLNQIDNASIRIFDMTGKLMLSENANQQQKQINVGNFSKGIYFIQLKNKNGITAKKFVKE